MIDILGSCVTRDAARYENNSSVEQKLDISCILGGVAENTMNYGNWRYRFLYAI